LPLGGEGDQPPVPVSARIDLPPSGIRLRHSCLQRSRLHLDPAERRSHTKRRIWEPPALINATNGMRGNGGWVMTVSPSQPEARSRAPMAYVVLRSQTKEGEGIDGHSLGNGTAFSAVAAPNLEKPRHGSRVSFNRLNLRCFPWRLPIFGGRTPVRPRGMPDSVGYLSRKRPRRKLPGATGFHSFAPSPEYETVPLSFECLKFGDYVLGEDRCFAHQSFTRSAVIVSFGPTMRLTAWPSSNCEQASFSAASLVG
jgi:hypothetical protein